MTPRICRLPNGARNSPPLLSAGAARSRKRARFRQRSGSTPISWKPSARRAKAGNRASTPRCASIWRSAHDHEAARVRSSAESQPSPLGRGLVRRTRVRGDSLERYVQQRLLKAAPLTRPLRAAPSPFDRGFARRFPRPSLCGPVTRPLYIASLGERRFPTDGE